MVSFHLVEIMLTCLQFMNKVLYAREGARTIMDRTFADFPWQVRVEVDGVEIEVPEVNHSFTRTYLLPTRISYLRFFLQYPPC